MTEARCLPDIPFTGIPPEATGPTREICKCCDEDNPVGFDVPDDVWLAAVPAEYANRVLCLQCFAKFADERLIAWDKGIKLYPVSMATHLAG